MTQSQKDKRNFRATKKWKVFKAELKKKRKIDEITCKPLQGRWQLHHKDLDESHYKQIENEQNFSCLNSKTHEFIHFLYRYYIKDKNIIERIIKLLDEMEKINVKNV